VPVCDYASAGNFGGVQLSDKGGEPILVVSNDSLHLPACQLIKIDVEGQEQAVIAGAVETIARFRPVLYVENDRRHDSPSLIRQIRDHDYVLCWHLPSLYRADNFYGNPTNLWPKIVSINMLCLPSGDSRKVEGMKPVGSPDDWPFPK
jgi:hypothetical protein